MLFAMNIFGATDFDVRYAEVVAWVIYGYRSRSVVFYVSVINNRMKTKDSI